VSRVDWPSLRAHELRRLLTDFADEQDFFRDGSDWTVEQLVVAVTSQAVSIMAELHDPWTLGDLNNVVVRLDEWLETNRVLERRRE
jgi:hypothetical protein